MVEGNWKEMVVLEAEFGPELLWLGCRKSERRNAPEKGPRLNAIELGKTRAIRQSCGFYPASCRALEDPRCAPEQSVVV